MGPSAWLRATPAAAACAGHPPCRGRPAWPGEGIPGPAVAWRPRSANRSRWPLAGTHSYPACTCLPPCHVAPVDGLRGQTGPFGGRDACPTVIDFPPYGVLANVRVPGVTGMATVPGSPKEMGKPIAEARTALTGWERIFWKMLYQAPPVPAL